MKAQYICWDIFVAVGFVERLYFIWWKKYEMNYTILWDGNFFFNMDKYIFYNLCIERKNRRRNEGVMKHDSIEKYKLNSLYKNVIKNKILIELILFFCIIKIQSLV